MFRTAATPLRLLLAGCLFAVGLLGWTAQGDDPPAAAARLFDAFTARPIGPANMGGRIVAVAVVESNPAVMYVATASGGLWKTTDGGLRWEPVFDRQKTISLGDVALAPSNPDVVWV